MKKERAQMFLNQLLRILRSASDDSLYGSPDTMKQFEDRISTKIEEICEESLDLFLDVLELSQDCSITLLEETLLGRFFLNAPNSAIKILDELSYIKETSTEDNAKRVDYFINHQIDVSAFSGLVTILDLSLFSLNSEASKKLINLGANIHRKSEKGPTTFDMAFHSLRTTLELNGRPSIFRGEDPEIAVQDLVDIVFDLLKVKTNINRKTVLCKKYPLQIAIELNKYPALQLAWQNSGRKGNLVGFLLSEGAKTGVQDKLGNTPLHIAIERGDVKLAKLLMSYDFPIIENNKEEFPIDVARQKNLTEIVRIIEARFPCFKKEAQDAQTLPTKPDTNTISQTSEVFKTL